MENTYIFSRKCSSLQIYNFLLEIEESFVPELSCRVNIAEYAIKLTEKAETFSMVDLKTDRIIGSLLIYINESNTAYIPLVGVVKECRGKNIAKDLFKRAEEELRKLKITSISLETWLGGDALTFYIKNGFYVEEIISDRPNNGKSVKLKKNLLIEVDCFDYNPTPLAKSDSLSALLNVNLFLKRDDLLEVIGGGSKARKLKYILKRAQNQGCNALVTAGANQSNHVRTTAVMSAELSWPMTAVIHDSEPVDYSGNLKLTSLCGAKMVFVDNVDVKKTMDNEIASYVEAGYKPFYIWGGGHSIEGSYAYYKAIFEIRNQLKGVYPDYIIVASGTGTTQAGIEVGVRELFPDCKVLGVSIARDQERGAKAVMDSANELALEINNKIDAIKSVFFDDSKMGGAYEAVFPELIDTIKNAAKHGLLLDPTYSGKAFYALTRYIEEGIIHRGANVIFWHTGGIMNLLSSAHI